MQKAPNLPSLSCIVSLQLHFISGSSKETCSLQTAIPALFLVNAVLEQSGQRETSVLP